MMSTEELLNGLPAEGTLRFFATFARFEFAMKQCGYLRYAGKGRIAEACRQKLRDALPTNFFDMVRDAQTATTLISRPPKNLFAQGEAIPEFGEQSPALTTTTQLLNAVWQVRNNLFHGNKMYPADRERDVALMGNSLAVIDAVMQPEKNVSSAFHDPQQFF